MNILFKGLAVKPKKLIGWGGEAEVFDIGSGKVLKVFKTPDHPDLAGMPHEQRAAKAKIAEHQNKLPAFPKNLPAKVIVPEDLATDADTGGIVGYTMRFLDDAEPLRRLAEKPFRQGKVGNADVIAVFKDLHSTLRNIHAAKAIVGDMNDLNILLVGLEAYFIDADSFQFGKFLCRVFTEKFVDPRLCDPKHSSPLLAKPFTPESDWYAFNAMLMECLLFVGPYGGFYKPKPGQKPMPQTSRPMKRITVFDDGVKYPKPAVPYDTLPDELLEHFNKVFKKDLRGEFPLSLLGRIAWRTCDNCGFEFAKPACPVCGKAMPPSAKDVVVIRGKVKVDMMFKTGGQILFATVQGGRLLWLYYEGNQFKREDGSTVKSGPLPKNARFRLLGNSTLIGSGKTITRFKVGMADNLIVDAYLSKVPMFDTNEDHMVSIVNDQLGRITKWGHDYIGDVIGGQTLFWMGKRMGFGLYRAGQITIYFVFDPSKRGINDSVKLPPIRDQLLDATCYFCDNTAWFIFATKSGSRIVNKCFVVKSDGSMVASSESEQDDDSWLGRVRGKCAVGKSLLASTDEGVRRVDISNGEIVETAHFPDTDAFVDSSTHLFPGKGGLYAVGTREIRFIQIL